MKKSDYGKDKNCPKCGLVLDIKKFRWKVKHYESWCMQCTSEHSACSARKRRAGDVRFEMVQAAKTRARKRGRPFSITIDDVVVPAVCPILGITLKRGSGVVSQNSPSLDEIRVGLGYIPGNVQVLSNKANAMKSNATLAELVAMGAWAKALLRKRK